MGKWGQKRAETRRAVTNGGTVSGGQARRATQVGGLGDDGLVRNPRGQVTGDFRNRRKRGQNQNGV
ncbi:hypothetical protein AB0L64_23870 [Kribbella sp. NPDC051936]|uniref:hypothetical protein n=1 Tax=Kribbella sp. NPDC051936 TaxID=3154946 RepID=UPI00343FA782